MAYVGLAAVSAPVWGYRLAKTGKWRTDWAGRFGRCRKLDVHEKPRLLIHAVSVGEVMAIERLVRRLLERAGDRWQIVISTTTDTGHARAEALFAPELLVVRYPLDLSRCVKRFLDTVKPDLVALTELEVWPNFVVGCHRRGVPVCVINGRLSSRSYKRYRWVKRVVSPSFAKLAAVAVQTEQYREHFVGLGTPGDRVQVLDSMKWDTTPAADESLTAGAKELARVMGIRRDRHTIVAGSTGPGEEKLLMDTCPPDAQLVVVPRKPERFDEVANLTSGITRRSGRPDGAPASQNPGRLFLIDTIGDLLKAYALADVAIVGRSFLGMYGSNVLEPIGLGVPTIIGPHHSDFAEIVGALSDAGGLIVTDHPGRAAAELLNDRARARALAKRASEVILSHRGATERHVEMLLKLMQERDPEHRPA